MVEVLSQADTSISDVMREFASFGVEAAYFVPTRTGLDKSIIDATETLRHFLRSKKVHDFGMQSKGPDHKVALDVDLVKRDHFDIRTISLYRPETKDGDPRFWIGRLSDSAKPGNLLALFVSQAGRLTVVNCSDTVVWSTRRVAGSPLQKALTTTSSSSAANELLANLREVCKKGYVTSLREGPTGVGFTLETLLGIKANSSKSPDFKGIELKAGRVQRDGASNTRTTLFSKTPDWKSSSLRNGGAILAKYGYEASDTGRLQLYCSLDDKPNTQGLYLAISDTAPLVEMRGPSGKAETIWPLGGLEEALAAKHKETFWVSARQRRTDDGREEFLYEKVTHTRRPLLTNLGPLIASGAIEMDLTLSRKPEGGTRDHGYLFKIWQRDLELLFPPPVVHQLAL